MSTTTIRYRREEPIWAGGYVEIEVVAEVAIYNFESRFKKIAQIVDAQIVAAKQGRRGALPEEVASEDERERCEQLGVQLAGCLTAAEGGISDPATQGTYGWSPAYQVVLELRQKYEALVKKESE